MLLPPLYAILDAEVAERAGWTLGDLASAYLAGGARWLQIRAKNAASLWLLDTAAAIVERAHAAGALVVVNDRADIARLSGADGVHVGQDDLVPTCARTVLGGQGLVGLSTHSMEQVESALAQPISYLAIGPVFATTTKVTDDAPVGLEKIRAVVSLARPRQLGVVAIGGVTLESASAVIEAGVDAVAVISDLLTTGDPEARVRAYVEQLARVRPDPVGTRRDHN